MNIEKMKDILSQKLSEKRLAHSLRVMETCEDLAEVFGANVFFAKVAGLLHDIAREEPFKECLRLLEQEKVPITEFELGCPQLLHAKSGAIYAKNWFGVHEEEILEAIRFHTTGRSGMGLLEKIVFMADYIEPGRKFPGVDEVRRITYNNLEEGMEMALKGTVIHLIQKRMPIHPDTILAYNSILFEKKAGGTGQNI